MKPISTPATPAPLPGFEHATLTDEKNALITLQDAGYLNPGESLTIGNLTIVRNAGSSWQLSIGDAKVSATGVRQLLEDLRGFFGGDTLRSR